MLDGRFIQGGLLLKANAQRKAICSNAAENPPVSGTF